MACFGSPIRIRVARPARKRRVAARPTAPDRCPGIRRSGRSSSGPASATGPPRHPARSASASRLSRSSYPSSPRWRLRRSTSARTATAKRKRSADTESGGSAAGSSRASGSSTALRPRQQCHRTIDRRRLGAGGAEPPDEQIVHHLDDQIVEVLDQRRAGFAVPRHTQSGQHLLAELVRGGDGRRVEIGERPGEPAAPDRHLARRRPSASRTISSLPCRRALAGSANARSALHQLLANPLAELLAGRPTEGDHQQLVEPGHTFGHVPGDQRADRVGLAGAGTGFQDGGADGQRIRGCRTASAPADRGARVVTAKPSGGAGAAEPTGAATAPRGGSVRRPRSRRPSGARRTPRRRGRACPQTKVWARIGVLARKLPRGPGPPRPELRFVLARPSCATAPAYSTDVFSGNGNGSRRPRS